MMLKDAVKECPYETIRLCCENGTKFIYIGKKDALCFETLDKTLLRMHREDLTNMVKTYRPSDAIKDSYGTVLDNDKKKKLEKALKRNERDLKRIHKEADNLANYQLIAYRQVVDSYPSTVDGDFIFVVTGNEGYIDYSPKIEPLTPKNMDITGAQNMLIESYKQCSKELTSIYEEMYRIYDDAEAYLTKWESGQIRDDILSFMDYAINTADVLRFVRPKGTTQVDKMKEKYPSLNLIIKWHSKKRMLELEILSNQFDFIKDPQGIIDGIRKQARENVDENKKAFSEPDKEEVKNGQNHR